MWAKWDDMVVQDEETSNAEPPPAAATNGEPLPRVHEGPVLSPQAEPGPHLGISLGPLAMTSGILSPADGDRVAAGPTDVIGYAFAAQGRRVARVDVSLDGGRSWTRVVVDDAPSPWAWQLWHTTMDLPPGPTEITGRAWDDTGATQPELPARLSTLAGYADNSWPRVRIEVG
jgi:sulfite oxidase